MKKQIEESKLQWGHGIAAVEFWTRVRDAQHLTVLQWGHGIAAVEFAD